MKKVSAQVVYGKYQYEDGSKLVFGDVPKKIAQQ
jgi:hypothetical protein